MKQEPTEARSARVVGIPVLQGREDVNICMRPTSDPDVIELIEHGAGPDDQPIGHLRRDPDGWRPSFTIVGTWEFSTVDEAMESAVGIYEDLNLCG